MDKFKTLNTKKLQDEIGEDDVSNLLVVILDTNPFGWDALSEYIPFDVAIREFLVFLNAHLSSNQNNDLAVLASHTNFVQYLYPSVQVSSKDNEKAVEENKEDKDFQKSNIYRPFYLMNKQIQDNLKKLIDKANEQDEDTPSTMIGGSLCMALAYVNRAMQSASKNRLNARILIISVSSDITFQYIPIMNCIFGAQKKKIPIDVCKIGGDTVFLQQASDATKGIYLHLDKPKSLLQYLLMIFLPDQKVRQHLVLPFQLNVDFRAACFCHKKILDIGFVCSVCLSS
ncbi:unnamed protein product [Pneumocystis jirovecii]|uniref:General transcription and DNA repair factor IIH subunit TFB4 n=1 Tax=Pneumocystis jirovecii TaxID=42068 RepID=L0PFC3_PNEJI|nr:unnamed protein product [Pneumocystis jirovecii]CCJ31073.1 unnamed protein product [Pneumocystis jirovecii]